MSAPRPSSLVRLPTRPRSRASSAARAALSPARAASARFAPAALSLAALALASACSDGGVDRADAETRGLTVPGSHVLSVAVGFEIWNGPITNLESVDFYVDPR